MTTPPQPPPSLGGVRPFDAAEIEDARAFYEIATDADFAHFLPPDHEKARRNQLRWMATLDAHRAAAAAVEARVAALEAALREAMRYLDDPSDYYGNNKRTAFEARVDALLAAPASPEAKGGGA